MSERKPPVFFRGDGVRSLGEAAASMASKQAQIEGEGRGKTRLDRILRRPQPPPRQRGRRLRQPHDALLEPSSFGGFVLDDAGHGLLAALELPPAHLLGISLHLGPSRVARERAAQPFASGVEPLRQHPPLRRRTHHHERIEGAVLLLAVRRHVIRSSSPTGSRRPLRLPRHSFSFISVQDGLVHRDELGVAPEIGLPQVHIPFVRPVRVLEARDEVINRILVRPAVRGQRTDQFRAHGLRPPRQIAGVLLLS